VVRAGLWTAGDQSEGLPSVGQMLAEATEGQIDGATYDAGWASRAAGTMW
jgi:hypothetical protein